MIEFLSKDAQLHANVYSNVRNYLYKGYGEELYREYGQDAAYAGVFQYGDTENSFIALTSNTTLFPKLLAKLTQSDFENIRTMLRAILDSRTTLTAETKKRVDRIKNAPQFSVNFQSRISKGNSPNLYRSELILDSKIWKLSTTVNASFDFQNSQTSKPNRNIGRFAAKTDIPLLPQNRLLAASPLALTLSGEGDWGTNGTPIYKAQGKLRFTVFPGFEVLFAVLYANQAGGVQRGDLKGQIGLAFDFSKMTKAFANN